MARQFDAEIDDDETDDDDVEVERVRLNRFEALAWDRPSFLESQVCSGTLDDNTLGQALQALGIVAGDRATLVLMEHLQHPNKDVVASAIEGLRVKAEGPINPAVVEILKAKLARVKEVGVPVTMSADQYVTRPRTRK